MRRVRALAPTPRENIMRRTALTCLGFVSLVLTPVLLGSAQLGCSNAPSGEKVIRTAEPIQGGTVDQTDSAVVAILINSSQGLSLCSGSLVAPNLVLSAHHCVADNTSTACGNNSFSSVYPAGDFLVTTSYDAAAQVFNGNNPQLPSPDGVTWFGVSSVAVPGNDICGQDLSALRLSSSVSGVCPLIPSVDTDVSDGEAYTAIGFGITSPNGQTAGTRYDVTGMTVSCAEDCNDPTQSATEEWLGVNSGNKGTCEGDSGGPAIDSLGRVIGSVSRGPANACNQTVYESYYGEAAWIKQVAQAAASAGGYAAAGWVTGAATSSPTSGYCGGSTTSSSSSGSTSSTSTSSSSSTGSGSSSGGAPTTCSQADGTVGCCEGNVNYYCTTGNQLEQTTCTGGKVCGWSASLGYYACVKPPGGSDPSNTYPLACGGSSSTTGTGSSTTGTGSSTTGTGVSSTSAGSTSSSSGSMGCGFTTGVAACDDCLSASCCAQETACANDATCTTCVTSATPPASCNTDTLVTAFADCFNNTCATQCGSGSSSSSSSGTATTGAATTRHRQHRRRHHGHGQLGQRWCLVDGQRILLRRPRRIRRRRRLWQRRRHRLRAADHGLRPERHQRRPGRSAGRQQRLRRRAGGQPRPRVLAVDDRHARRPRAPRLPPPSPLIVRGRRSWSSELVVGAGLPAGSDDRAPKGGRAGLTRPDVRVLPFGLHARGVRGRAPDPFACRTM